jgi:hypothetical protein
MYWLWTRFLGISELFAVALVVALAGCSPAEPDVSESSESTSPEPLTEGDVERIARDEALDVLAAEFEAQRQEETRKLQHKKPAKTHDDAVEAETILETKSRREMGYLLLTPAERQRADEIREVLRTNGLAGFADRPADLRWAWYGEGHDALEGDMLAAAESPPAGWLEAAELFGLEGPRLLDFWCEDPIEALGRIALARELQRGAAITEEMIRFGRTDPLVRPLLIERLRNIEP